MDEKALSLNDFVEDPHNINLVSVRRMTHFALLEGKFSITTPEDAFLFDSYMIRMFKPSDNIIKHNTDNRLKEYLLSSLEGKDKERPQSIEIGTTSECNRRCVSCIQAYSDMGRYMISSELWNIFVNQVSENARTTPIEDHPIIHLHWYNEPLKDKQLIHRLEQLKDNHVDNVVLITNGDFMNVDNAKVLSNLTELVIVSAKSKKTFANHQHHNYEANNIVCIDHSMYNDTARGYNRCGTVPIKDGKPKILCSKGFNLEIDHDGTIYLCCNDMAKSTPYGHIMNDNIFHLWKSEPLKTWREQLSKGTFNGDPCNSCAHDY